MSKNQIATIFLSACVIALQAIDVAKGGIGLPQCISIFLSGAVIFCVLKEPRNSN